MLAVVVPVLAHRVLLRLRLLLVISLRVEGASLGLSTVQVLLFFALALLFQAHLVLGVLVEVFVDVDPEA